MNYNLIEELPDEYICQVCMKLLNEPQLTECCGQHFCRACLEQWFQERGTKHCPHCRRVYPMYIISWPLQRKINELKVYCSNRAKGCGLTMKLGELEEHLSIDNPNGCGYVTIKCLNLGCNESHFRNAIVDHRNNTCLQRKVKCKYCGEIGSYLSIIGQNTKMLTFTYASMFNRSHLKQCLEYPVDCPRKCDTVRDLKHKDLEAHKEVCPLEPVECPFREAGCTQQLVRKDLDTHIQFSTQQHLLLLMTTNTDLMTSHKALMREHKELQSTVVSVASELECMQTIVKGWSIATSLERITATLNQVSLNLETVGDKITFRISGSTQEWRSPIFSVDGRRMYLQCRYNQILHVQVANRFGQLSPSTSNQCTLSLIQMNGELQVSGKYQINITLEADQAEHTNKTGNPFYAFPNFKTVHLCPNCIRLTCMKQVVQHDLKSGHEIAKLHTLLNHHQTRAVKLTLEKHVCILK